MEWPSTTTDSSMVRREGGREGEEEMEGGRGERERERKGGREGERERSQNSHLSFSFVAFFIRPFYKMMLKKAITLDDMQSVVSHASKKFKFNLML